MSIQPKKNQPRKKITWNEIKSLIKQLSKQIPPGSIIWGVPRNGLLLSVMLSHYRPDLHMEVSKEPSKDSIIIDDIYDSGETLNPYIENKFVTATLYWRKNNKKDRHPAHWVKDVEHNAWLIYPWECE